MARLVEIEAVRDRGGDGAYKAALTFAVEDRLLVQEVKAVDDALTARFGWSAFTAKADVVAERNMVGRMPEDLAPERSEKLARLFTVIRRFAEEQHLAERQDRSKIVAGASVEVGKETVSVLPMLAAVTEFKRPVDEEARERVLAIPHYRHYRTSLAETATGIWRDPAGVVAKIEELVVKGFAGERIGAAVSNDPSAYGALRGSDRIMDKMLAVGRERKAALQAMSEVVSRVRSLGASFVGALDTEIRAITEERRHMAIAIPGLSQAADDALRQVAADIKMMKMEKEKGAKVDVAAGSLDPLIRQEFAAVSRALDERFGRNAILRGEPDVFNRVSPAQRRAFEAMQERLQVLQETVRMHSSQEIISERRRRAIDRARGLTR